MDFAPNEAALQPWIERGMTFVRERVTPENLGRLLGQHVSTGDLLIDLAWNIVGGGFPAHYDDTVPAFKSLTETLHAELDRLFQIGRASCRERDWIPAVPARFTTSE